MLTLDFINVGCGDALLGRTESFTFMVDCGSDAVEPPTKPSLRLTAGEFLKKRGVERIDLMILTHFHNDHVGGLTGVMRSASIEELWSPWLPPEALLNRRIPLETAEGPMPKNPPSTVNRFLDAAELLNRRGCMLQDVRQPLAPTALTEDLSVEIAFTSPSLQLRQRSILDGALCSGTDRCAMTLLKSFINLTSLRVLMTYRGQRIFLPGDAYGPYWRRDAQPPCAVLKVPHHASAPSVNQAFLEKLHPETAVASVSNDYVSKDPPGDTDAARPAAEAMALLNQFCGAVFYTDCVSLPDGRETPQWDSVQLKLS